MKFILVPFVFCLICSCSRGYDGRINAPLLHKIDIQQGNVIDQEMINKLTPGLDKKQVEFIMGTPVLIDPFHNERWEYIYSFSEGGKVREQRHITLHFENGKLAYISGDIEVSNIPRQKEEIITEDNAIIVPESDQKEGFFSRLLKKINPLDGDE
tara:strand:+ start:316 stop:780 length:465 start_codon:yes stop_codon:yes gene_type:complete